MRMKSGRDAEDDAIRFLKKKGYRIISVQERKGYKIRVDEKIENIVVIADIIAEKKGKIYIVEVKTGKDAPSLKTSSTRRQLLEYLYTYRPDGIILLDMEKNRLHTVRFPFFEKRQRLSLSYFILGLTIGGMIIYFTMRIK